jgi:2-dehydro-3-deoxyphosphooctonate aldolase (KDO 8-P synthase)
MMTVVRVGSVPVGGGNPLVLIAGPCVIESEDLVMRTAETLREITGRLNVPLIFKSSYTKDNRSSAKSWQGPGLEKGLAILQKVKARFGIPVLSDVHDRHDMAAAGEVLDVIQIPAYLCMQTEMILEAARTGRAINVKKGQFLDPGDMKHIIGKIEGEGNRGILLTERGSCFGYHNLVVDMRSLQIMRGLGYPVVFDPTHAIRIYGVSSADPKGGAPQFVPGLSRAGAASGIDAIFIETHPNCREALCDAASMWPLQHLEALLVQIKRVDELVKSMEEIRL